MSKTKAAETTTADTSTTTADTGATAETSSNVRPLPVGEVKAAPRQITREQATEAMIAIDDLRKRLVKEAKSLQRAQAKAADLTNGIELRQRTTYLEKLEKLHCAFGEAFDLGGY